MREFIQRSGISLLGLVIVAGALALTPVSASAEGFAAQPSPPVFANPNLPDLVAVADAGPAVTSVTITNRGYSSTGVFLVRYQHENSTYTLRPQSLGPGQSITLTFPHNSLSCAPHIITLDPENWVRERSETNNSATVTLCPGL